MRQVYITLVAREAEVIWQWFSRRRRIGLIEATSVDYGSVKSRQIIPFMKSLMKQILLILFVLFAMTFSSSAVAGHSDGATVVKGAVASKGETGSVRLIDLPVIRETLANGLKVVLSPNHTIPTVAVVIGYNVGSRNEAKGSSGYAHLFEHLMFQGSRNVGKMEHFQLVTRRGGDANGGTGPDYTAYYETLPASELELGLWLEADRMKSLAITQENFENQRQTVMEERRESYDNQPYGASTLRVNELAYGDYWPYAHSTIGDMQDLQRATLNSVKKFSTVTMRRITPC